MVVGQYDEPPGPEPAASIEVTVPEQFVGDVMIDLNAKRARILGMRIEQGCAVMSADVPLVEIQNYVAELDSITSGQGSYKIIQLFNEG